MKKGLFLLPLIFGLYLSQAQTTAPKMQALQHIKIVKTPVKGEDKLTAQLASIDRSIQTINAEIQKALTDLEALKALQQALNAQLDSINEMSEMTSMDLQMAMDRRSKFVETLSNVLKKISDTQASIVQNMK
jgi:chromosome segregation ATPase